MATVIEGMLHEIGDGQQSADHRIPHIAHLQPIQHTTHNAHGNNTIQALALGSRVRLPALVSSCQYHMRHDIQCSKPEIFHRRLQNAG